ncbi:MAG TPA: MFS transporter [Xanthobacteraceae bacterium]|nr:MFS transporter [Xanthobacteraceae bacterium]
MSKLARLTKSRWRAIPILGVCQILAWGAIYYTPVLVVPLIAAERGWSLTLAMGGFSVGLFAAGLSSPFVGVMIDRHGGHRVMPLGALLGAAGLLAITYAADPVLYFAVWIALGAAMAASLYDPAFATLARIFGADARRAITLLTFIGGFASTVSWPATHFLIEAIGWRGTYVAYAVLLALVSAPLLAFALPREHAAAEIPPEGRVRARSKHLPARGVAFLLVAVAFALYAFIPSALSAHMLAIFTRAGIASAAVVAIGALFGPAQVTARLLEFTFARKQHPLVIARFAVGLLIAACGMLLFLGVSVLAAASFAILFGLTNGLMTIARGTVPLALFGPTGYGRLLGRIARPALVMQSVGPLVLAFVAERFSDPATIGLIAAFALAALACFAAIRRP